jgi:transposase
VAVDTLGHLLAVAITPANEQERAQVDQLCQQVQEATEQQVKMAFVDQGYTGQNAAQQAQEHAIELVVVQLAEAKRGFVLLPRRWVVERTFAWLGRFRRLARDYERLSENLTAYHWLAATSLMLASLFTPPQKCITGSRACYGLFAGTSQRQRLESWGWRHRKIPPLTIRATSAMRNGSFAPHT